MATAKTGDNKSSYRKMLTRSAWVLIPFIAGIILIHIGESLSYDDKISWLSIISKTVLEVGVAFIVASAISFTFDIAYHHNMFGKPVEEIEIRMQSITEKVSKLNCILDASQKMKIEGLYQRQSDIELIEWRERVERVVYEGQDYIYIMGRTLDELFPTRYDKKNIGIINIIREKLQHSELKEVKFILANAYDENSEFRQECMRRMPRGATALYQPAKYTVEQLLRLKYDINQNTESQNGTHTVDIKVVNNPHFLMIMTHKSAIVQNYIPFVDGRSGIVFEVENDEDSGGVYRLYKNSYMHIYNSQLEELNQIITRYLKRKPESVSYFEDLIQPMQIYIDSV